MVDEKDHSMGLRLDGNTYRQVQELSDLLGVKKSQIIKMGIRRLYANEKNNIAEKIIIFDKSTFRKICELISLKEIEDLAEHNAQQYIIKIRQKILQDGNKNLENIKLGDFLSIFTMILGRKYWKWVENMTWQFIQDDELLLFINHDINSNFSLFMKILLKIILNQIFETQLIDEKTILAENQLELHFKIQSAEKK